MSGIYVTLLTSKQDLRRYARQLKAERYARLRQDVQRYVREHYPDRYAANPMATPDPMKTPNPMNLPSPMQGTQRQLQVGDTVTENGHTYVLNRNHRWERSDKEPEPEPRQPAKPEEPTDRKRPQPEEPPEEAGADEQTPPAEIPPGSPGMQAIGRIKDLDILKGAQAQTDGEDLLITSKSGNQVKVRILSAEEFQQLAQEHPGELQASSEAAGGAGEIRGAYRNGELLLREDATPAEISHEVVHALQDMELISKQEVDLFGGPEKMAYAYQQWVQEGRNQTKPGIFERIWDFLKALFGDKGAQQRQVLRKLDSGKVFQDYHQEYASNPESIAFSIEPTKVNYAMAKGLVSEKTVGILDTVRRLARIDGIIGKLLKQEGGKGKTQKNAENINNWLQKKPELLQELQQIQAEAQQAGYFPQILDPKDPTKIAPYTLEDRPKVWTNVKVAFINPKTMRDAPKGSRTGQWHIVEADVYKDARGNKYRFKIAGPFPERKQAADKAHNIFLNGLVVDHINKRNFGAMARSLPQTYLETLGEEAFEQMRGELTKGVEDAYATKQLTRGEFPEIRLPGAGKKKGAVVKPEKMFDKTPKELGDPHKDFRLNAPIKEAHKTVAAFNLSTMCPMFHIGNHGCYLDGCYVTAMGAGANPINMYRKAMYTGELLQMSDDDVAALNSLGGLRMNGMGDLDYGQRHQIKDVLKHAAMRGLQLKMITKQDATFRIVSEALTELEKEGHQLPDVTVQPSIDPYYIPITEDDKPGAGAEGYSKAVQKALDAGETDRAKAMIDVAAEKYKEWGRDTRVIDGMLYRKYGFTGKQVDELMAKYPNLEGRVKKRLVISNGPEAVWAALNHPGAVVTWMHARVRKGMWSEATNGHLSENDPQKGIAADSPGNFPGRPVFVPPAKEGGRWQMMVQDERALKVTPTEASQAVVDYIYTHHPEQADRIFKNLQSFSCCQGGTSENACQDCQVHCATGRGDRHDLVPVENLVLHVSEKKAARAKAKEDAASLEPFQASRDRSIVLRYVKEHYPAFYARYKPAAGQKSLFDQPAAPPDPQHPRAPAGGTTVAGETFAGGEWIPKEKVAEVAEDTGKSQDQVAGEIAQGQDPTAGETFLDPSGKPYPPHMQALLAKAKARDTQTPKAEVTDVTPEGYGPEPAPVAAVPPTSLTPEEQAKYDEYVQFLAGSKMQPKSPEEWVTNYRAVQARRAAAAAQATQDAQQAAEEEQPELPAAVEDANPDAVAAAAGEPLVADNPRAAAEAVQRKQDEDYEFARASAIGNRGEDLKGSARHKVNAWKGLQQAEEDGTAEQLVTRESLERNEPHSFMALAAHNPVGALVGYLSMKKFPPRPGSGHANRDARRNEEEKKKDRQQYVESWQELKQTFYGIAAHEEEFGKMLSNMQDAVADRIRSLRGMKPGDRMGGTDPANNTANLLVGMYKSLAARRYGTGKTSVANQLNDFGTFIQKTYPDVSPSELLERTTEHAMQVIEGTSLNKLRGVQAATGTRFNPADMYVNIAERQGGKQLAVQDPNQAVDYMVSRMGMRGLQWGNSVTDEERQHHAIKATEAMVDLMEVLGLEESDASLGGKLGLAIGARGHGTNLAHYEPSTQVINLTRKSGVGSLAHEWGHAFDHFLEGAESDKFMSEQHRYTHFTVDEQGRRWNVPQGATTKSPKQEMPHQEIRAAYREWKAAASSFRNRLEDELQKHVRDGLMSRNRTDYWRSGKEVFARTFERYVQRKLETSGRKNTYLAGIATHAYRSGGLWPTDEEVDAMTPAFDKIFAAHAQSDRRRAAQQRDKYCKRLASQLEQVTGSR